MGFIDYFKPLTANRAHAIADRQQFGRRKRLTYRVLHFVRKVAKHGGYHTCLALDVTTPELVAIKRVLARFNYEFEVTDKNDSTIKIDIWWFKDDAF